MMAQAMRQMDHAISGGRLVAADGRDLPLRGAALHADAKAGLARVVLEQRFANPYAEPLVARYSLPLPPDGVVSGYGFTVGDRRIAGEVDRRAVARERFEQALVEGRSAALLEQDRSSLFTQEIGNIPPGTEIVCEIVLDQRLQWLEEGMWEWRFPTVVAPRYLGGEGRVRDAERVTQDVAEGVLPGRVSVSLTVRDVVPEGGRPESPSHTVCAVAEHGGFRVALAENARLDRDVVVRWPAAQPRVGLTIDTGRPPAGRVHAKAGYGLLTLVPPALEAPGEPLCRDVIVLLDTSGSMSGEPLDQARSVVAALVGTLSARDRLEIIAFASSPQRWKHVPVEATDMMRRDALGWLNTLRAAGGTEMLHGIVEALKPLRGEAQRQVVLVTDGLIGFENEVVSAICKQLPAESRLHVVGVGSAVNRALTAPAARAGRGVEVIIGLGEDAHRSAQRVLARTDRPLAVGLEIDGSALLNHAPARLPDLHAGTAAQVALKLRPEGGELHVRGRMARGMWEEGVQVAPIGAGEGNPAVVALYGRELVEDLELRRAANGTAQDIDARIEQIGLDFQITTRLTSWVAVSETRSVDPREPVRRERIPHELPYGLSIEGLGLRPLAAESVSALACTACEVSDHEAPFPDYRMARHAMKASRAIAMLERARRGRLVLRKGRRLVIEFLVDRGVQIDWEPAVGAEVTWDDGTSLAARLNLRRSTRPGTVSHGCAIRVALVLAADPPDHGAPVRVALRNGGERLVIDM